MKERTKLKLLVGLIGVTLTLATYPITWLVSIEWSLVILVAIATTTVSIYSYGEDLIEN